MKSVDYISMKLLKNLKNKIRAATEKALTHTIEGRRAERSMKISIFP